MVPQFVSENCIAIQDQGLDHTLSSISVNWAAPVPLIVQEDIWHNCGFCLPTEFREKTNYKDSLKQRDKEEIRR